MADDDATADPGTTDAHQLPTYQQPTPQQPGYSQPYGYPRQPYGQYPGHAPQPYAPQPYAAQPYAHYPGYGPAPTDGWFLVATSYGPVPAPLTSPGKRFGAALLEGLLMLVTLWFGWAIWSLIAWERGQSPAKQLLGMRVVDATTHQVATWGKMALREFVVRYLLFSLISMVTLGIGWIVAACMTFSRYRNYQSGWDRIASTVVVDGDALPV